MKPLQGVRIIDFSRMLPGPLATKMLMNMGADVTKIEHPVRKDYAKFALPGREGVSELYRELNDGKTILEIDYQKEKGVEEIAELIKTSDILVEQFRPGAMKSWKLGFENVKKINQDIIYVSISGFGQKSKDALTAAHDLNYLALSGLLSLNKDQSGRPVVPGFQLADIAGGSYKTVNSILQAIIHKQQTGSGIYIDISMNAGISELGIIPNSIMKSGLNHQQFNILNGKTVVNYAVYECREGKYIAVGALELKFWANLCNTIQKPEWIRKHQVELFNHSFHKSEVEAFFKTKKRDEWIQIFEGEDVCVSPVLDLDEIDKKAL